MARWRSTSPAPVPAPPWLAAPRPLCAGGASPQPALAARTRRLPSSAAAAISSARAAGLPASAAPDPCSSQRQAAVAVAASPPSSGSTNGLGRRLCAAGRGRGPAAAPGRRPRRPRRPGRAGAAPRAWRKVRAGRHGRGRVLALPAVLRADVGGRVLLLRLVRRLVRWPPPHHVSVAGRTTSAAPARLRGRARQRAWRESVWEWVGGGRRAQA